MVMSDEVIKGNNIAYRNIYPRFFCIFIDNNRILKYYKSERVVELKKNKFQTKNWKFSTSKNEMRN